MHSTIKKRFGSWLNALELAGVSEEIIAKRKKGTNYYTDAQLIDLLKQYYKQFGEIPQYKEYTEYAKGHPERPTGSTYMRRFGSWTNALIKSGFTPQRIPKKYENMSSILQDYKKEIEEYHSEESIPNRIHLLYDLEYFLHSKGMEWKDLDLEITKEYFTILKEKGMFKGHSNDLVKPNSPTTLKNKYKRLCSFLNWILEIADEEETEPLISKKKIKKIKKRIKSPTIIGSNERASKRRALSQEQVFKIREAINSPVLRNIFNIGLNLGLRRIEYTRIKLDHLHLDDGCIDIIGKRSIIRDIALTDAMKELIEYQLSLRELNNVRHEFFFFHPRTKGKLRGTALNSIYRKLSKKLGFKWNAHEVRYTMAALMLKKGVTINIIAQRMGHSPSLTFHYSRENLDVRITILEKYVGIL